MVTAEQIVESWLVEQGFDIYRVDISTWAWTNPTKKWKDNQWRFYLYPDLEFTAYNVYRCSYMSVSLKNPQSINKITEWIKGNRE